MKDIIKNVLVTAIICFSFLNVGNGQVTFGGGLTYLNELGIQARTVIGFDKFNLIPKASYYIVDNTTSLSFDLDASYDLVTIGEDNPLYLFAGPALYRSSSNGDSDTDIGLNFGTGLEISQVYGEVRYTTLFCTNCGGEIGFALGYMF